MGCPFSLRADGSPCWGNTRGKQNFVFFLCGFAGLGQGYMQDWKLRGA